MNKDHRHDLSAILQHHTGTASRDPELTDISLSTLTITADGQSHTLPISPPMTSWSDRRARLVEMTLAARSALGLDADGKGVVAELRFVPPSGLGAVVFAGVVFYFVCFAVVEMGGPGGAVTRVLQEWFPGGAGGFEWLVKAIFWPVMGIHVGECWWLDRTRLGRYGVRRGGRLWWLWMGRCFFEGVTAFKSFDGLVEGKMKAR